MNDLLEKGVSWIGNPKLLEKKLVGVFSSEWCSPWQQFCRDQWAMEVGRRHQGIVGVFHSQGEKSVLKQALDCGGCAVWLLGRRFPAKFSRTICRAFREGRLLLVSCFWIPRSVYGTISYCASLVEFYSERLVIWGAMERGYIPSVRSRALRNGKRVEVR